MMRREKQEWWIGRGAGMDGQEGKYSDKLLLFTMRVLHCMSSKGGNEVFTHLHLMMIYYSTNFFLSIGKGS